MRISAALLLVATVTGGACSRTADATSWALLNASVVDVIGGRVAVGQTVLVRGDRIVSIGSREETVVPRSVRQVDVAGAFIVPGLFDMHTHLFGVDKKRQPPIERYLANGVVGIRDLGSPIDAISVLSKSQARRPAIWFAGPIVNGPTAPEFWLNRTVASEGQAREAVAAIFAHGAQFVKVHDWLSRPAYLAIVENARQHHLPVVGHVPAAISMDEAREVGQQSVEHLGGLTHAVLRTCSHGPPATQQELMRRARQPDKGPAYQYAMSSAFLTPLLDTFDEKACTALAERLARDEIWQTPNLVLWRDWANEPSRAAEDWVARQRLLDAARRIVRIMYESGVPLLAGSDEIGNIHDELALLTDAGLPPVAALRSATVSAAAFLGVADSYGVVKAGRVATFLVVDGDPLVDIRNLRRIRSVVLRGEQFDKATIAKWSAQ
ncbi:MAG TPA: amidohydrolase family protein [Steroidobacteraceae bacterium]